MTWSCPPSPPLCPPARRLPDGSPRHSTSRTRQAEMFLGRGDLQLLGIHHVAVHGLRGDGCHIGLPELQPCVAFGFCRLLAPRQPHILDRPELPEEPCAAGPFQRAGPPEHSRCRSTLILLGREIHASMQGHHGPSIDEVRLGGSAAAPLHVRQAATQGHGHWRRCQASVQ